MQHPKHGRMPVYSNSEALTHEKNGWARFEFSAPVAPVQTDETTEVLAPRRGRPPKER